MQLNGSEAYRDRARPGQFAGVDGWVMAAAADYFNFTPLIRFLADNETHGYSENGKGTGTLGEVMSGRAWISFNSR